ncbi:hypothetical protein [Bacillus sp. mrc49]|uniref:hypothetical protein n=1 Tax=Bacillus sp. mrc49 TaxID=2054913 RepID=UPI000C27A133|nr:hypothetical protein [Bacillus sp. mrc49]PJN90590.1 hypothetical protein CVN76_09530 [Bacillus sp. mrc49]
MKKFELYEQYLEQGIEIQEARQRYDEKVEQAENNLTAAKIKLDEVVHIEIQSGIDKSKEKSTARKAIEQADKELGYANEERAIAHGHFSGPGGNITRAEIVQAYIYDYIPSVKSEYLPSIQERMKQGADLMLSAFYDFNALRREYHEIQSEIKDVNDSAQNMGEQQGSYYIANAFGERAESGLDINKLAWMLQDIENGYEMPEGSTYIKQSFKSEGEK